MATYQFSLVDAFLCVCLAAHIHGTDDGVKKTVRRCQKKLPFHDARKLDVYLKTKYPLMTVQATLAAYFS